MTRRKIHVVDPAQRAVLVDSVPADVLPLEYGGQAELRTVQEVLLRET